MAKVGSYPSSFNPRICKRCDVVFSGSILASKVSIHASVKDATEKWDKYKVYPIGFNPRICKRCDICIDFFSNLFLKFQSTHL